MSVSVPLIGDPKDQLLEVLPFVHTRARDQCHSAIRRLFDAITEQENVQIMLNLATPNGPTLLAMAANVVRTESNVLVLLTGREVDCALADLIHTSGSVPESDVDIRVQIRGSSETDFSSITGSSESSSLLVRGHGGQGPLDRSNSATSRSADEEPIEQQRSARQPTEQPAWWERASVPMREHGGVPMAPRLQRNRAEEHWDSDDSDSITKFRESRRVRFGFSDTSSIDSNLQHLRLQRRDGRAIERRRYALRAACSKLRAVGAFMRNGRNKTKRMLAMWLRTNENMNLAVVRLIGKLCWKDGWRGVADGSGGGVDIRLALVLRSQ